MTRRGERAAHGQAAVFGRRRRTLSKGSRLMLCDLRPVEGLDARQRSRPRRSAPSCSRSSSSCSAPPTGPRRCSRRTYRAPTCPTCLQIVALVDAVERGLDDAGIPARLDLLLQVVALGPAGDVDERRQPVERREDLVLDRARLDVARPADDQRSAHAAFPGGQLAALEGRGAAVGEGDDSRRRCRW